MKSIVLQSFALPNSQLCTERELFVRTEGPVAIDDSTGKISLGSGGQLKTNTYFNTFPLQKWMAYSELTGISLLINGSGVFEVTVFHAIPDRSWERVVSKTVSANWDETCIPIEFEALRSDLGVLFVEITAIERCEISDVNWLTYDLPLRTLKTAIVITTFNRDAAIRSSLKTLLPILSEKTECIIVDNGRNLTDGAEKWITVIPNDNFGGSGGFARGALEAKARGFTHVIFMDDDVQVHPESVLRALAFLAYASNRNCAISGALANARHRWMLHENAARFDGMCRPYNTGSDLRNFDEIFNIETQNNSLKSLDYGAWWFFAFKISSANFWPFPFFVRGDDVSFSLSNNFSIVTLPGVISFQDQNFDEKTSPWVLYLDLRSHLAHMLFEKSLAQKPIWLVKTALFFPLRSLMLHQYASVSAMLIALEHTIRGPKFYTENLEGRRLKSYLEEIGAFETWTSLDLDPQHKAPMRIQKLFAKLSMNGMFIPFFRFWGAEVEVHLADSLDLEQHYGASKITLVDLDRKKKLELHHEQVKSLVLFLRIICAVWRLFRNRKRLLREWREEYPKIATEQFWSNLYSGR